MPSNFSLLGRKVTLFSLPEVFCGPKICQKCVGGRGSAPDPSLAGKLTTLPRPPSRLKRWTPLPNPHLSRHLRRLDSRAFGAQRLCPNVKSWHASGRKIKLLRDMMKNNLYTIYSIRAARIPKSRESLKLLETTEAKGKEETMSVCDLDLSTSTLHVELKSHACRYCAKLKLWS